MRNTLAAVLMAATLMTPALAQGESIATQIRELCERPESVTQTTEECEMHQFMAHRTLQLLRGSPRLSVIEEQILEQVLVLPEVQGDYLKQYVAFTMYAWQYKWQLEYALDTLDDSWSKLEEMDNEFMQGLRAKYPEIFR